MAINWLSIRINVVTVCSAREHLQIALIIYYEKDIFDSRNVFGGRLPGGAARQGGAFTLLIIECEIGTK